MYHLNLPEQTVAAALNSLSEQTDIQVLFPYDIATQHQSTALVGNYPLQQALTILLLNTGLHGGLTDSGVITISRTGSNVDINQNGKGKRMNTNKRKTVLATMVGLFAAGGMSATVAQGQVGESARAQGVLEEIVVTSTRRETSLNDTAVSVAAITGEEIARRNLSEMNDYLRIVPGVNFIEIGLGANAVVTRGIGVDPQVEGSSSGPTTGVYFGEVSVAGLGSFGGNANIQMIDLERVEVLRGPQGTLFGSGALAGAVRNIPNAPDLSELGGSVKATYSNTEQNGGGNTKFEGVINVPVIEDVLAVRAVAYHHDTSGYIENIAADVLASNGEILPGLRAQDVVNNLGGAELYKNENDLGAVTYKGGRIAVLWEPNDALSVTVQHVYQDAHQDGHPYVELAYGDYEQVSLQLGGDEIAGTREERADELNISNLVVEYDFGWANLLSSSAWMTQRSHSNQDQSAFDGGEPFSDISKEKNSLFTQELRLVSALDGAFQYVAGVYYEDRQTDYNSSAGWAGTDEEVNFLLPIFGLSSNPLGDTRLLNDYDFDRSYDQLAFYGELSYDITERLELSVGARRFDYERVNKRKGNGIFGPDDSTDTTDEQDTSLKANISYQVNDDTLLYGQWAEGFRLGSTNSFVSPETCDVNNDGLLDGTSAPIEDGFGSDTLENFELGAKLTLLDGSLQATGAIYRMNWEGIPVRVLGGALPGEDLTCFQTTVVNAGKARSQGLELEFVYQVNESIRVNLGGAYVNAELTEDAPSLSAVSGDRLPSSPKYTANVGLQYDFEVGGYSSYLNGNYAYVSDFYNKLGENGVKTGDYGQLNMLIGITFSGFNIELFAKNLTDDNALTHADVVTSDSRAYRLRPRTIGLNVGYDF